MAWRRHPHFKHTQKVPERFRMVNMKKVPQILESDLCVMCFKHMFLKQIQVTQYSTAAILKKDTQICDSFRNLIQERRMFKALSII